MADNYRVFASYLLFAQVLEDPLGHLYRAGEFGRDGIGRMVWLRAFDGPQAPTVDITSKFERARAIGEAVQSTNVAGGISCLEADGVPALVCEYVTSQPLGLVLDRVQTERFPVPVDNALLILEKIALALSAGLTAEVEGERVLHGFLHPGLIFVTYDGECVVSGFGLGEGLLALVDAEDLVADIHPYLAPEVLESRAPSRHGDVYSLGAILFQLLTGSTLPAAPEAREGAIDAAHLAYDDEPVPDDIKTLLVRSLAGQPQERFSSAADFKKELDRLLYGGAYSPTTFNLALFMDRLFRSEMESEDRALAAERDLDVTPYLAPVVVPEPEPVEDEDEGVEVPTRYPKGMLMGIGSAALVAVAAVLWFILGRGPSEPPPPPAPTAVEIAAQRQAQEDKMRELAQSLVQEMMAEKEDEIRMELTDRQTKIEELQQRLVESEKRAKRGGLNNEEERRRELLQRQIAAEEETQRQREVELEAERLRAEEEALQQAAVQRTATAVALEEAALVTAAVTTPTPLPPTPTEITTPEPTAVVIAVNTFVEPSDADSLPVVIREHPVEWPVTAARARRQGVIIMQATVNADGLVEELKVLRADEEGFGIPEAAIEAAKKYRFKPGTKDGVRIKTYATITKTYRFATSR